MAENTALTSGGTGETSGATDPNAGKTAADPNAGATDPNAGKTAADPNAGKTEAPVVPEKYEFKLPEGFQELDGKMVEQFTPIAKELKLSNEQAQKVVDLYAKDLQARAKAADDGWKQIQDGWKKSAKDDAEIGGQNYDAAVARGRKAIQALGTPALAQALDQTGVGDHPEIIRFFSKVGRAIEEGKIQIGNTTQSGEGAPKSLGARLFPTMQQG